jgi:acyl-CoA thioester hydrolase
VSGFEWQVRVYYEDTDSGGVVYYANYLRFMERARTEWMRALGFEQDQLLEEQGVLFAVRSASIEYLRTAHFNDLLCVSAAIIDQGRASLTFSQEIRRCNDDSGPVCTGEIKIACLDAKTLRPRAIPEFILKEIADVE